VAELANVTMSLTLATQRSHPREARMDQKTIILVLAATLRSYSRQTGMGGKIFIVPDTVKNGRQETLIGRRIPISTIPLKTDPLKIRMNHEIFTVLAVFQSNPEEV
jgi:hypothetical protein